MYEYIKGTVAEVAPAYAVIDVGGVGYYLHISLETYSAIEHETETRLYVHYVVREDAQLLYGFSTKAERELFRLLISVSGVGGNTARMILSTYSPRELQGIITAGNAVLLKNVKGLGLKTAQKIIFSGIAGNMTSKIGIGDVVIGKTVLYHDAQLDMICQNPPFLKEYTGDPELIAAAEKACAEAGVKALVGKIATGDLFVGDSATKAAIEAKCAPDCVEMEGAAVSQIAAKNGVPCVILRAMSDNADEDGHEVLVVKKFSIAEYVATATKIVAAMVEAL